MDQSVMLVVAIVRPFKLDAITQALARVGVGALTISEAQGHGRQEEHTHVFRGSEYKDSLLPMLKLEAAIPAWQVNKVTGAIGEAARTGQPGDGKIFVVQLDDVVSVSTGRSDEIVPPLAA
jgi:nitrogen regulatory protein P-II 2